MLESDQPVVAERPPTKLAKDGSPLYYAHYKTPDGRWNRFHDLRHTYAAMMISLGENIKFIQTQMGHSTISTTLDRYGHLLPEASEGVGRRLDALVFSERVIPFPAGKEVI